MEMDQLSSSVLCLSESRRKVCRKDALRVGCVVREKREDGREQTSERLFHSL